MLYGPRAADCRQSRDNRPHEAGRFRPVAADFRARVIEAAADAGVGFVVVRIA
jgi:hypothetical protein